MKCPVSCVLPLLAFLALSSCERDARLDLGDLSPEIVVLSNFSDLDTLEVVVSKTRPVLDEGRVEYPSDATVVLFVNGFFADTLQYVPSPVFQIPPYYLSSRIVPMPGDHCRLVVSVPGLGQVEGESTMPVPAGIDTGFTQLEVEKEQMGDGLVQATLKVKLKIPGAQGPGNFFHLSFYQEGYDYLIDQDGDTIKFPFFSLPLAVTPDDDDIPFVSYIENRGILFSGEALEGNQGVLSFTLAFQYNANQQILGDFLIELRTTSEEYYKYHRSLARQHQAGQHPFSEPVILYSNIEDGQGIFAAFVSRFYRVSVFY